MLNLMEQRAHSCTLVAVGEDTKGVHLRVPVGAVCVCATITVQKVLECGEDISPESRVSTHSGSSGYPLLDRFLCTKYMGEED